MNAGQLILLALRQKSGTVEAKIADKLLKKELRKKSKKSKK